MQEVLDSLDVLIQPLTGGTHGHISFAQRTQKQPRAAQQAKWQARAMAKWTCPYISLRQQVCVSGPRHLLSVGPLVATTFLVLITTPSVGNADVAERVRERRRGDTSTAYPRTQVVQSFHLCAWYPKCVNLPISFPLLLTVCFKLIS